MGLIGIALAVSSVTWLVAHNTVEFHTGQTAGFETQGGEDADTDGADKSYNTSGCGANTVIDNQTNLCWERDDRAAQTWQTALTTCHNATTGGKDDWRLPNVGEAVTMLDYSCSAASPTCQSNYNNNALNWVNGAAGFYWTSTTRPDFATFAFVIDASSGNLASGTKTSSNFVRCVRQAVL